MNKISKFLIFLTVLFALSAIFMFSRMGWTDGSVNGLIQNLKDENSQATIESMLADKGEAAVEPLIEALKNENTNIAKGAAEVLGMIKDVRAVEPLIKALEDENDEVRHYAAEALGEIKDGRAVGPLIEALKDENADVVYAAAWSLGIIGDKKAIRPLIETLYDKSDEIQIYMAEPIENDLLIKALEETEEEAVWAIGNIAELTGEPLIESLKDEELMVIDDFYNIFIDHNNPSTEAVLIKVLNEYGTPSMALCCVNCDNSKLVAAGQEWADSHGYFIVPTGFTFE